VPKEDTQVDWVRYAAVHTMNVAPGPFKWVNWWMSFLNFQIEHHLFPSMPQFRHPIINPRVKALFEKHGLVYDQRSYAEAMAVTFRNLHKVGNDVFHG
jgi:acyl-CoA 6-desaturase (Delta-6 desaturase)